MPDKMLKLPPEKQIFVKFQ